MAALIKQDSGIDPDIVTGARGEFTVWVDGTTVAKKSADGFPTDEEIVAAVRAAV
ncbi:MAG: hypothetical protein O2930_11310 [Acidobacteria bacterium]|nr:hypothetical protein [Acidobacteriota bacterium]